MKKKYNGALKLSQRREKKSPNDRPFVLLITNKIQKRNTYYFTSNAYKVLQYFPYKDAAK